MNNLKEFFKETLVSILPVVVIVLILSLLVVDVSHSMLFSFIIGALLVLIGLTIFLYGIETGMAPAGKIFGEYVSDSNSKWLVGLLSFIIGFSITVAEPDLIILGQQIETATAGILNSTAVILSVSLGVGLMIALGVERLMNGIPFNKYFLSIYAVIMVLAIISDNPVIAMAFDASGATTGALTPPFILVLSASIALKKAGTTMDEDSFGLVGSMSTGPILAIFLLVLFTGSEMVPTTEEYVYTDNIVGQISQAVIPTLLESAIALLPIIILFLFLNIRTFKLEKKALRSIFKGFVYTILGLALFLIGVNEGFMDMGHFLGAELAEMGNSWLVVTGLILGLVVVLAEPAVQVLGDQVNEISEGRIKKSVLLLFLSIGVGIAVSLSMLRIIIVGFEVWHILLPGFIIALLLSFYTPPIFTGIAFDAGGVASGPMAVTFILAFAQGAAAQNPQADALDGFGVIALIAMTPVVMVEILGTLYKLNEKKAKLAA